MQTNSILSRLASEDCQSLLRRAERVRFEREAVLAEIGSPIERVLFPLSGMVSIVVELTDGARTECAMLGARGAIEYTRGRIQILDAQKLADSACECHDALKQCHRSLFKDAATEGSDSKFQGPVRESATSRRH